MVAIRHGDEPTGTSDASHTHVLVGSLVPAGGTTGQVLTKKTNTDGDTDWEAGGGGGGALLTATVTLTSAQIKALFTTPVQLVAAPGAGKAVMPLAVTLGFHAGVTPYADNGARFSVQWNGAPATNILVTPGAGFIDQSTDQVAGFMGPGDFGSYAATDLGDTVLAIVADVANPTLGNGTIKVTLSYVVVTL